MTSMRLVITSELRHRLYCVCAKLFGWSDIPNNAGFLAPFTVDGPKSCILYAQHPAPIVMRHRLGQVTPDLPLACLHQALPDKVTAEGASCMFHLTPREDRGGGDLTIAAQRFA